MQSLTGKPVNHKSRLIALLVNKEVRPLFRTSSSKVRRCIILLSSSKGLQCLASVRTPPFLELSHCLSLWSCTFSLVLQTGPI